MLKVIFTNPEQAKLAIAGQLGPYCRKQWEADPDTRLIVTVQPQEDDQSAQQRKFLWGVVYRSIAEQAKVDGVQYAPEAWHELCKRQFLPREVSKVHVAGKKRPVIVTRIGSTTGLGVKAMSAYITEVMAWAQTDLGVQFPASPEEIRAVTVSHRRAPAPQLGRPKFEYVRSKPLLEACRELACQSCGADDGTVVAAHSNQSKHGKGKGIKASDVYVAALCRECHHEVDQGNTLSQEERVAMWDEAHARTVPELVRLGLWPQGVAAPEVDGVEA